MNTGFNSTLVRFKLSAFCSSVSLIFVSIPLWFDSNTSRLLPSVRSLLVSIPLWFDSNTKREHSQMQCEAGFNSTLVRFKHSKTSQTGFSNNSFNSTLVRFKRSKSSARNSNNHSFNSTLVRFKPISFSEALTMCSCVSIPLWFDSNPRKSHYFCHDAPVSIPLWFDSNLRRGGSGESAQPVSIPLWFDSNLSLTASRIRSRIVSIPLWFDSNLWGSYDASSQKRVSIPLWFDSNAHAEPVRRPAGQGFNSTLVRFKLPPSPGGGRRLASFNSTLVRFKRVCRSAICSSCEDVSIPLWFDSNTSDARPPIPRNQFQFHSGSIQTILPRGMPSASARCFNSTLVRFKPLTFPLQAIEIEMFQFHSGSIQTPRRLDLERALLRVSIPLWFDSNYRRGAVVVLSIASFNSTLVRFKLF